MSRTGCGVIGGLAAPSQFLSLRRSQYPQELRGVPVANSIKVIFSTVACKKGIVLRSTCRKSVPEVQRNLDNRRALQDLLHQGRTAIYQGAEASARRAAKGDELGGVPDSGAAGQFADWGTCVRACAGPSLPAISDFLDDQKDDRTGPLRSDAGFEEPGQVAAA